MSYDDCSLAILLCLLPGARFDVADRQYISIPQTWKDVYNGSPDVKELIPEFFFLPEFLTNVNSMALPSKCFFIFSLGFDLGIRIHTGTRINDILLPNWASSPEDFIQKHREALVSPKNHHTLQQCTYM